VEVEAEAVVAAVALKALDYFDYSSFSCAWIACSLF
jgi:hypothetical protein